MAKSKGKEKFQFKKFMLYNGQWVAVGVAGFFLLILGGSGLVKVITAKSSSTNARELTKKSEAFRRQLTNQGPPATDTFEIPAVTGASELVSLDEYRTSTPYIYPVIIDEKKRRNPSILPPAELSILVVQAQVRGFMLGQNGDSIWVLKEAQPAGHGMAPAGGAPGVPPGTGRPAMVQPGLPPRKPGAAVPPGAAPPAVPLEVTKQLVPLEPALLGKEKLEFAEMIVPTRMVVISGSFPLKEQLEEYRSKLRFKDMKTYLEDQSVLPIFRGFKMERRTLDAYGQPKTGWEERDLGMTYARLVNKNELGAQTREQIKNFGLLRFQADDPQWQPFMPEGLVMPLHRQFPPPGIPAPAGGNTPAAKDKPKQAATPATLKTVSSFLGRRKQMEGFDLFNHDGNMTQVAAAGQPQPDVPEGKPYFGMDELPLVKKALAKLEEQAKAPTAPVKPGMPSPVVAKPSAAKPQHENIPDHVFVRIVDGFVEPGFYEYRIRILAENPNFNRTDLVAWSELATEPVLQSEWWEVPRIVVVPPDLSYYVLGPVVGKDQQRGPAFQLHRWVEDVAIPGGETARVGDWLIVAPREPINRGEFVTRTHQVQVPIWKPESKRFVRAARPDTPQLYVPVPFGGVGPEPILVDFEGVEPHMHIRNGPNGPITIQGNSSVEVLILSPDGKKLVARDSAVDKATLGQPSAEPAHQINSYVTRLKEARQP